MLNPISRARLIGVHPDLVKLVQEVAKTTGLIVVSGYRNKEQQNAAVALGNSDLKYPKSKHNKVPSLAVDLAPFAEGSKTIDWHDVAAFKALSAVVLKKAHELGIKIIWGGTFKGRDVDYPHYELA